VASYRKPTSSCLTCPQGKYRSFAKRSTALSASISESAAGCTACTTCPSPMLLFGCNQGFGGPQEGKGVCGCPTGQRMAYQSGGAGGAIAAGCIHCPSGYYADTSKFGKAPLVVKVCTPCKVCGHLQKLQGCASGSTSHAPNPKVAEGSISSGGECYCTGGRYAQGRLCLRYTSCESLQPSQWYE
jgi:hypothetical protein